MYDILFSNQFKRSYKKCLKRGYNKALFEEVVTLLAETGPILIYSGNTDNIL